MNQVAIVTGCGGLIGSEATRRFLAEGYEVIGIDNDMRRAFFGDAASTAATADALQELDGFTLRRTDIRERVEIERIVNTFKPDVVVHCAAQPSHDWAVTAPHTDFGVNAIGTLNLLEATRIYAPRAAFVHCSTSKVYGDNPNRLPLIAGKRRYDLPLAHDYYHGIDTTMSIDQCLHSLFGASKASADLLVQEYGRYFGMKTVCFRPGCLTGADHAGAELHGFLAYMMQCCVKGDPYRVYGYNGLQVRCNIHARDLVDAFVHFVNSDSTPGVVYNIGGGRENAVSMIEAIARCEQITGTALDWTYVDEPRIGDHMWWISDNLDFEQAHPNWRGPVTSVNEILRGIAVKHQATL